MKGQFLQFLETSLNQVKSHKQIAVSCDVENYVIELHDEFIAYLERLQEIVSNNDLAVNYINNFQNDINNTLGQLTYRNNNASFIQPHNNEQFKRNIEKPKDNLSRQLQQSQFNLDFFRKLNFFNHNIVAIGANGSGKTTLSNNLKGYLQRTGVVIAAQKILIIPNFSGISNFNQTSQILQQLQNADKTLKNSNADYSVLTNELRVLLDNLFADNYSNIVLYNKTLQNGDIVKNKPITNLDKVLCIWNSLIQHRVLKCDDGINLSLKSTKQNSYPAHQMSDGEKVALYLIAQVLQAPQNGFIIVDEPEMYLHKTILKKLWDRLEQERPDCIFVYLTHDLDFATSRNAKKVWIKSYMFPDKWEIEDVPENELPEPLLLELLGSRKPILFCEGKKGSNDEKIYNYLFPEYTITPVENCFAVIHHTKAFNKIPNKTTTAYGLIDADHHSAERLNAIKQENIFSLSVAEVENLLLQEEFLTFFAKERVMKDDNEETRKQVVEKIKNDTISDLKEKIELQISNYVSAKIDCYFKDSNVKKGNTQKEVEDNYTKFADEIKISDWYSQRKVELEKIISDKDYSKVLAVYNNKGLKAIANKYFNISDFTDRAIKFLQSNVKAQEIIKQNFPQEIIENQNASN